MVAELLAGAEAAYGRLLATLDSFSDDLAAGPSILPGWTRAMLITHLARNADANRRMAEGAIRGIVVPQYEGGAKQREQEILAGKGKGAREVLDDLLQAQAAVMATWERMPDEAWDRLTGAAAGARPARRGVWARWREIDIHHVDLDLGYRPEDWPDPFLQRTLPSVILSLSSRQAADRAIPEGSCILEATDQGRSWMLTYGSRGSEAREAGQESAGVVIRGPSFALLVWLLGRRRFDQVRVECIGGGVGIPDLPNWYPYP